MRMTGGWIVLMGLASAVLAQEAKPAAKRAAGFSYPPVFEGAKVETYKKVGATELQLWIFNPADHRPTDARPAVVFFFGGGWTNGSPAQFHQHCRYLASRGMVAVTADYRVKSRHEVVATECVADAKSAVRYLRQHAERLGIDPRRLAAGGGSAGGHLAAATATIKNFDAPTDRLDISAKPNALVLYNPAAALAPLDQTMDPGVAAADLKDRLGCDPVALSPAHHVAAGAPPTVMFFGTDDKLLAGATAYEAQMKKVGSRCELITYAGRQHGFFNHGRGDGKDFLDTLQKTDQFLVSLGWLAGPDRVGEFFAQSASK